MAVKSKPVHISSQIKNVLAHLNGVGIRSKVLNKQVMCTCYVPGCVLFVGGHKVEQDSFSAFREDRFISIEL